MPPCHGGDRRFESGRARHRKRLNPCDWGFFYFETCLVLRSDDAGAFATKARRYLYRAHEEAVR